MYKIVYGNYKLEYKLYIFISYESIQLPKKMFNQPIKLKMYT